MTDSRSSSDSTGALEYLSVFADSGYYELSNVQVRAICAALRTPTLPSGEEPVAWQVEGPGGRWLHVHSMQMDELRNAGRTLRPLFASSPTPRTSGDRQVALDTEGNPVYRTRDVAPPFSRWADIIEAASLTISPKGSEALNALAAEVRAGGVAQAEWMPIETAPKDGYDILVTRGLGEPSRIAFWDTARGGLWSMWPGRDPILPVYWMPVPRYSVSSTPQKTLGRTDREGGWNAERGLSVTSTDRGSGT